MSAPAKTTKILLTDDVVIPVSPSLARVLGICESFILQQLHYWLSKGAHHKDGRHWVYNTQEDWAEKLQAFSKRTIQRAFSSLLEKRLVIVGNYNRRKYDRTIWYTIDYEKLEKYLTEAGITGKLSVPIWQHPYGQIVHMVNANLATPIPEIFPEISSEKSTPEKPKTEQEFDIVKGPTTSAAVTKGILENHQKNKAVKSGAGVPYKNTAHTLEYVWKEVVPTLETSGGCIPAMTMVEKGMLGKMCKAWGTDSEHILPNVLTNWISFTNFVGSTKGIHKMPTAPTIPFLLKFVNEASAFHALHPVQLIAQKMKPKSKIVITKTVKVVQEQAGTKEVVEDSTALVKDEPLATLEDVMKYLKF